MKNKIWLFLIGGGIAVYWYLSNIKNAITNFSYKIINVKYNAGKTSASLFTKFFANAIIEICNPTNAAIRINSFYVKFKIHGTNEWIFDIKNDKSFKVGNRQCIQIPVEISIDTVKIIDAAKNNNKNIDWKNPSFVIDYDGHVIVDGISYPVNDSIKLL
jgi:hypothetical protein